MGGEDRLKLSLKLIMEEGPLKGQIIGFKPRMRIQIGRVVRGNTLSIKDAGISSKHLLINFESEPISCWTISDLGSSNGTLLNELKLDSFTPTQLTDGDVIGMGELTSIKVKFEEASVNEDVSKVRRNPPRLRGGKLAVDENKEFKLGKDEDDQNAKGWSRRGKGVSKPCKVSESKELTEGQMVSVRRVTRRTLEKGNGIEGEHDKMENLWQKSCLRGKGNKSEKLEENEVEDGEEMENIGQIEAKDARNVSPGRLRSLKREKVSGLWGHLGVNELGGIDGKGGQRESLRRITRSMSRAQMLENLGGNRLQNGEGMEMVLPKDGKNVTLRKEENLKNLVENGGPGNKKTRKGNRGKRNLGEEMLPENIEDAKRKKKEVEEKLNSGREEIKEVKYGLPVNEVLENEEIAVDGLVKEGVNLGIEGCEGLASMTTAKDDDVVDLEKMTLGDWFDYLEVHLPRQVTDATEEMILGMKLKAEKFHEFMLEQKNSKYKFGVPIY